MAGSLIRRQRLPLQDGARKRHSFHSGIVELLWGALCCLLSSAVDRSLWEVRKTSTQTCSKNFRGCLFRLFFEGPRPTISRRKFKTENLKKKHIRLIIPTRFSKSDNEFFLVIMEQIWLSSFQQIYEVSTILEVLNFDEASVRRM